MVESAHHGEPAWRGWPGPRILTLGLAVVSFVVTILPWWQSELPLRNAAATLNGWQLVTLGLSIGDLAAHSPYGSWFGNAMFGLVSGAPAIVVVTLLSLRTWRLRLVTGRLIQIYALLTVLSMLWLSAFAWLRLDAANGAYPMTGWAWLQLVIAIGVFAVAGIWWRKERARFPKRSFRGFGDLRRRPRVEEGEQEPTIADLLNDTDDDDEPRARH